jgi:hypothetical protein
MTTTLSKSKSNGQPKLTSSTSQMLSANQLAQVLNAIELVGAFGEVHLVIHQGELRFIRLVQSFSLLPDESVQT